MKRLSPFGQIGAVALALVLLSQPPARASDTPGAKFGEALGPVILVFGGLLAIAGVLVVVGLVVWLVRRVRYPASDPVYVAGLVDAALRAGRTEEQITEQLVGIGMPAPDAARAIGDVREGLQAGRAAGLLSQGPVRGASPVYGAAFQLGRRKSLPFGTLPTKWLILAWVAIAGVAAVIHFSR